MMRKRMNTLLTVPNIDTYLKTRSEVLIDYPGEDRERHSWTIAAFNLRTGNNCQKFVPNRHINEVI